MRNGSPCLPVRIRELITLAEDEGRIYEQLVIGNVESGEQIALFDIPMAVRETLVGKRCSFVLSAFLPRIQRISEERYEIKGWDRSVVPRIHNRAFSGRIVAHRTDRMVQDIRCGTIFVVSKPSQMVEVGTFVRISDFRLDIDDLLGVQKDDNHKTAL